MKYNDIRDSLKSGDLLAYTQKEWNSINDLASQVVRLFTQSEYCHVGLAKEVDGEWFVLEATPSNGVHLSPLPLNKPFYWVQMDVQWNDVAEEEAKKSIGNSYSMFQCVLAFLGLLEISRDNKWECAELAIHMYKAMGLEFDCKATPTAVVEEAMLLGKAVKLVQP